MKGSRISRRKHSEEGIALLIAIVVLLLVGVMAIALIVASGTESTLAGNYRSATSSYYAALAGLEEGRGRLLPTNPNYFNNTIPTFMPALGLPLAVGQVRYILNPVPGEVVDPINQASPTTYPDTEYRAEFNVNPPLAPATQTINSISTVAGIQGPPYKWVRINAITEASINQDVNNDSVLDPLTPLYYDGAHLNLALNGQQALEVTTLAVLPDGTQKLGQYIVAPLTYNLSFPSALTLAGPVNQFQGANSNQYRMNGNDGSGNPPAVPGCIPNQFPPVDAIGVTDSAGSTANQTFVSGNLPRPDHYTGAGGTPSVGDINLNSTLQSPDSVSQLLQNIQNNADALIPNPPPAPNVVNHTLYTFGGPGWPSGMSANNPQVVYVDGDFDLGPNTGYGILVVTGNFFYHGNSGWKGIVLVVGDGTTTFLGNGGGNGEFDGAVFTATIRDSSGNLLNNFGPLNFDVTGGGGNGIYYNSCWIKNAQKPPTYKLLSFREISQ
jgi:hypothetical protein